MQEASKKLYSLAEAAKIVGADEKTIHLFAHKGLIHPHFSTDREARFTDVDCVRLKLIMQAAQLGYSTETIFDLLGHPEEIRTAKDPLSACYDYAMEKYKQIYNELNDCEPLEQINKQADLKLITYYIKSLKNLQKSPAGISNSQKHKAKTPAKPMDEAEVPPAPSPHPLTPVQPESGADGDDHPDRILQLKPQYLLWGGVLLCVLAGMTIALSIYFRTHSASDNAAPPRVAMQGTAKQEGTEPEAVYKKTAAVPSPPQVISMIENQSTAEAARSGKPSADQKKPLARPEQATPAGNQKAEETPLPSDRSIVKPPATAAQTASSGQTGRTQNSAAPQVSEATIAQLVDVEELRLWHDNLNHIYRSEFNILRNSAVQSQDDHVSGYVFVVLKTGKEAGNPHDVVMPNVDFISGRPARFPQLARFDIRNYKSMRFTAHSDLLPHQVASANVLVYSDDGDLLLDKPVSIDIRPFLSGSGEPRDNQVVVRNAETNPSPDSMGNSSDTTQPSRKSAPHSEGQPPSAQIEPSAALDTASAPEAVKPAVKPKRISGSKEQPVVKPQKTDDPEAASWEQKSYDAAVKGNFDEAIAHANKTIELDPGRINPYINRAWAYIEKNMLEPAIRDSRTALAIDPENAYAFNNLGLALQLGGETQEALENYRKACDLGFDLGCQNLTALTNQSRIAKLLDLSQANFKAGDWDSVVRATTEIINLDPQNASAYVNRSAAYVQKSYLNKALKDSNEAIKINPDFALAYNNRGYVYELLNNASKAATDYLKSCSLGLDLGCSNFDRLKQSQ